MKILAGEKEKMLKIGDSIETRLVPSYADFFTIPGGEINLSFTRDARGKITGFVFSSAGEERQVKGITFKRRE